MPNIILHTDGIRDKNSASMELLKYEVRLLRMSSPRPGFTKKVADGPLVETLRLDWTAR
jgi:hypothetical protein